MGITGANQEGNKCTTSFLVAYSSTGPPGRHEQESSASSPSLCVRPRRDGHCLDRRASKHVSCCTSHSVGGIVKKKRNGMHLHQRGSSRPSSRARPIRGSSQHRAVLSTWNGYAEIRCYQHRRAVFISLCHQSCLRAYGF